jgi:hypothetical protein
MSPWPTVKDHCPRLATFSWGLRAILMAYCLESKTSQDPGGTKLSMWWTWQPQTPECPTTGKGCRQRPSDAFSHSGMFASKPQKPRNHFHLALLAFLWCGVQPVAWVPYATLALWGGGSAFVTTVCELRLAWFMLLHSSDSHPLCGVPCP